MIYKIKQFLENRNSDGLTKEVEPLIEKLQQYADQYKSPVIYNEKKMINKTFSYGLFFILLLTVITTSTSCSSNEHSATKQEIRTQIKHAQTYYWFGMAEKGNMRSFAQGIVHLDKAEKSLDNSAITEQEKIALSQEIEGLRSDFTEQQDVHHDTFFGEFPFVRFFAPTIFRDALALGTFELIDDPSVMASTAAARNLAERVFNNWSLRPQLNVIFNSSPKNRALENEVLYVFNRSAKFFVHNLSELSQHLTPEEISEFQTKTHDMPKSIIKKLCTAFDNSHLLLVTIVQKDNIDKDYFYVLEGHLLSANEHDTGYSFFSMGFSRDRNHLFPWIIFLNISYLFLAVTIYKIILKLRQAKHQCSFFSIQILTPITAFTLGRITPWVVAPLFEQIAPLPENLAIVSFWWPILFTIAIFMVPFFIYQKLHHYMPKSFNFFSFDSLGGNIAVATSLGTCCYLATPFLLYLEPGAAITRIIFLTLVAATYMFHFGNTLESDANPPRWDNWWSVPIFIVILIFIYVLFRNTEAVFIVLSLISLALLFCIRTEDSETKTGERKDTSRPRRDNTTPKTINELIKRAQSPSPGYINSPSFTKFINNYFDSLGERGDHCFHITGRIGSGKKATANAIVEELCNKIGDQPILLLSGNCYQDNQKNDIQQYDIFLNIFPKISNQNKESSFQIESFLPFGDLLSSLNEATTEKDREDKYFSKIKDYLEGKAKKHLVFLTLNDIQWLDGASKKLLTRLLEEIDLLGKRIFFVLTDSNRKESIVSNSSNCIRIDIDEFRQDLSMNDLLQKLFGLSKTATKTIIDQFSSQEEVARNEELQDTIQDYFSYVAFLAQENIIIQKEDGIFDIAPEYMNHKKSLPIPSGYEETISGKIEQLNQDCEDILQYAALLGNPFTINLLEKTHISNNLFRCLNQIEQIGLIHDHDIDGYYNFKNSWTMEIVRKHFKITFAGPPDWKEPESIKNKHATIAKICEANSIDNPEMVFSAARHYMAAGGIYRNKAFEFCQKAVETAKQIYDFERAKHFINMLERCAKCRNEPFNKEEELLLLNCDKAFVENEKNAEIAKNCLAYLNNQAKCNDNSTTDEKLQQILNRTLLKAFCRIFYEAARDVTEQKEANSFLEIGLKSADRLMETAKDDLDKADVSFNKALNTKSSSIKKELFEATLKLLEEHVNQNEKHCKELKAWTYDQMARIEDKSAKDRIDHLNRSIKFKRELGDKPGLTRSLGVLGECYCNIEDFSQARENFQESLVIASDLKDNWGIYLRYCNFGESYIEESKSIARTKLKEVQKLILEAQDYFQKAWDTIKVLDDEKQALSQKYTLDRLLYCSKNLENWGEFNRLGKLLHKLFATDMLQSSRELITDVLDAGNITSAEWNQELMSSSNE